MHWVTKECMTIKISTLKMLKTNYRFIDFERKKNQFILIFYSLTKLGLEFGFPKGNPNQHYILNVLNLCDGEKMHLKLLCTQFEFEIFEEHF